MARVEDQVVRVGANLAREQNDILVLQAGKIDRLMRRRGMGSGQGHQQRSFEERPQPQIVASGIARTQEGGIERAGMKAGDQGCGIRLLQGDLDVGVGSAEAADGARHDGAERRRGGEADAQVSEFAAERAPGDPDALVGQRGHDLDHFKECPARRGEFGAVNRSAEQLRPDSRSRSLICKLSGG